MWAAVSGFHEFLVGGECMQPNEKVKCDRFSFTYDGGNTFGVHDIDLTIQEGEFIVLTGSSGCGKTTLTRCINGLIPDFFEGQISGSCNVWHGYI